nr:immunoglobulin heavy chain junction region [Macaca mulatta]MOV38156.1 immunoglobulin heavy chain junction region [Macaca mulatta]MOV38753.1 immunoglobulin heavy chain junction region [Macaca mulatta]MOV39053.1 immunoglobulin heavy chain junction region [Macaca mulatta]MOV39853.1 immunoglobulin heavy chain junction region [Macaca mulatta]
CAKPTIFGLARPLDSW